MPGAGLALLRAVPAVDAEAARWTVTSGRARRFFAERSKCLTRQIAENSGVDGGVVVDKMRNGTGNHGIRCGVRKTYVDLIEAGIIDPTKVVRLALENAVSVAGVLLLTEATMVQLPETKKDAGGEPELG